MSKEKRAHQARVRKENLANGFTRNFEPLGRLPWHIGSGVSAYRSLRAATDRRLAAHRQSKAHVDSLWTAKDRDQALPTDDLVLFLRSFGDDGGLLVRNAAEREASTHIGTVIDDALTALGLRAAGFGDPSLDEDPVGVDMTSADHDEWQGEFFAALPAAKAILVLVAAKAADGPHFHEELVAIRDLGHTDKVAVIGPSDPEMVEPHRECFRTLGWELPDIGALVAWHHAGKLNITPSFGTGDGYQRDAYELGIVRALAEICDHAIHPTAAKIADWERRQRRWAQQQQRPMSG